MSGRRILKKKEVLTNLAQRVENVLQLLTLSQAAGDPRRRALFFFSSRRRHTRWNCDWSSDVALPIWAIDIAPAALALQRQVARRLETGLRLAGQLLAELASRRVGLLLHGPLAQQPQYMIQTLGRGLGRCRRQRKATYSRPPKQIGQNSRKTLVR